MIAITGTTTSKITRARARFSRSFRTGRAGRAVWAVATSPVELRCSVIRRLINTVGHDQQIRFHF